MRHHHYEARRWRANEWGVALVSSSTGDLKEWESVGMLAHNARRRAARLNGEWREADECNPMGALCPSCDAPLGECDGCVSEGDGWR